MNESNKDIKPVLAVIFGGKSAEHEISLRSATNIYNAADRLIFDPILLGIDKDGTWYYNPAYPRQTIDLPANDYFAGATEVYLKGIAGKGVLTGRQSGEALAVFDVAFPIIHGTFGEDGTLQGILKAAGVPFAGPGVLASAIGMDKDVAKRLLRDAGIPVADFLTLHRHQPGLYRYDEICRRLGLPLFVKPANAGSSVGVSKVADEAGFRAALTEAFRYDHKVLVEEAIVGKEVECAILGNAGDLRTSVVGEIIPAKDFYSYDAKYISADGAVLKIPADVAPDVAQHIRETAIRVFETLCCEGMARVDFFLKPDHTFVLNEINTLPGFTSISMYPKLWEATGISYPGLITKLSELAMARAVRDAQLSTAAGPDS